MSQTLHLPDDLFDRLRRAAEQEGLSVEQLLARWVAARVPIQASQPEQEGGNDLLVACTRALLDGSKPPVAVDWDELALALQSSEPPYATVEEAMSALRHRPWKKDDDVGD
jgi:hypothetical protein